MSRFNVNVINTEEEECFLQSLIYHLLDANGIWSQLRDDNFIHISNSSTTTGANFNFYTSKTGWWCSYRNYDFIHLSEEKAAEVLWVYEAAQSGENSESSDSKNRVLTEELSKFAEGRKTLDLVLAIIQNHDLHEMANKPLRYVRTDPRTLGLDL